MSDPVIIALIGAVSGGLPTIATIISAVLSSRATKKNAAKHSIFDLINYDKTEALYGHVPTNYQNILNEYDVYHKNGGNSYVTERVEEYKNWYIAWQRQHVDKTKNV